jgi:putative endonuclease
VTSGLGRHQGGLAAEEAALRLYEAEGAVLVARRWRCPEGEIDLVVRAGGVLVFVEVKARRHRDAAAGAVSPAQWRRLQAAASRFLAEAGEDAAECRFDVVLAGRDGRLERIENAVAFDEW